MLVTSLACSIILNLNDEHWNDYFVPGELKKIKSALESRTELFPGAMQQLMDDIPKGEILRNIFKFLNNKVIDSIESRDIRWLKNTLQFAADLFVTGYLPLTNHSERDLIRKVWPFIEHRLR